MVRAAEILLGEPRDALRRQLDFDEEITNVLLRTRAIIGKPE